MKSRVRSAFGVPPPPFDYIIGPSREPTFLETIFTTKTNMFMHGAKTTSTKPSKTEGHLYFPL